MLSNIFVDQLHAAGLGLTKAVNLFAEDGSGDACVVVSANYARDIASGIPLRDGRLQVLVKGYSYQEGYTLSERACAVVRQMMGDYAYKGEQYTILSIVQRSHPLSFHDVAGVLNFSANFEVYFRLTMP